jgi:hypothetical protein
MAGSAAGGGGIASPVSLALRPLPTAGVGGGKGGGAAPTPAAATTPPPAPAGFAPLTPQGPFNVNQASAAALQQALGGTQRAIGNTGLLTNYVTDQTLLDLERQRQMQQNQIGLQASRAGAYGGSRHGVAEALTNEAFARQGAQAFGNLQLGQQQAQMRGAAQMGALGQQAFNIGQSIQEQQARQGLLQQAMQQQLIDAARGQYQGYVGEPERSMALPLQALGQVPYPSTTREGAQPGLYQGLQTLALMQSLCWVAREVYGEDDPKWLQFREWLIGYSPDWFFNAYDKYGEKVAKVVRKVPFLKSVIRPFMDAKRKAIGYK